MQIKILSALWGYEQYNLLAWMDKVRSAGFDGFDTWLPSASNELFQFLDYIDQYEMTFVAHQHQAEGRDFKEFKTSFLSSLKRCVDAHPLLINSHTGRDYFTLEQNLELIDIAENLSLQKNILIIHETHRGRFAYSPAVMQYYFDANTKFKITADFSHWTCVSESMLDNFSEILDAAFARTAHIHARIGYEESPQVTDFRAPEWGYATNKFFSWWDKIVDLRNTDGLETFTFTTEFGPFPYLPSLPYTRVPVVDLFEINCAMKDSLKKRYNLLKA